MTATDRLIASLDRRWLAWALLAWLATAIWFLFDRWNAIYWFALSDTDDNMRMMQVRALLDGQGWYDLRNYRLNPPGGFDIHWSRIVDLPIAGLILLFEPFMSTPWAERWAAAIAPLLPLGVTMAALAASVRRLVAPHAWTLALVFLLGAGAAMVMFRPLRIDHHGWQLAALAVTVAGLANPRRVRGGLMVGGASAFSLAIGLELLPYAAMAGAIVALRWVWDRGDARRLAAYALSLGGGTAIGYVVFASEANRVARCDALTPVWLSVMVLAGALAFVISQVRAENRLVRLGLAGAVGAVVVLFFVIAWPQCLGRPEQVSPELARMWLNNVREAKPIFEHPFRMAFPIAVLPLIGLIGAFVATWRARGTPLFAAWAPVALFGLFACLMMLWQVRAGGAAQLLGVPGAVAIAWLLLRWCLARGNFVLLAAGAIVAFLGISGVFAGLAIQYLPIDRPTPYQQTVNRAGNRCPFLPNLQALNRFPAQTVFTHSDLGPRLIVTTHHKAISGPYHRNGGAILDVHHAFDGSAEQFHAIARRHGATLLVICPNMAETTVYRARAPDGFYAQLERGQAPDWLEPVELPKKSPLKAWRIR
ncbi:AcrB/AcrD/AcrF family protein [Sphingomonas gilva]|uniref:AcrB/AcrD/AcrF family protein n=1 Tax=Sphingomonas gilva TaxID=2305907 RepID=A0A396RSZ9_9SPHN|nr:AcrB/AcrD/AcrF family protein [Sphingomonas gilva]RHW16741.1 AcrB/AcrD/AcrF family protein [Sphingomonas gilva]